MKIIAAAALAMLAASATAIAQDDWPPASWTRPTEPFQLIGNIYYVGTEGLSSFLITGPEGHILIDGAMPQSAPQIIANIRKLGFEPHDVEYLLINHSHYDHAGGLAALKQATGAKLLASRADAPDLEAGKTLSRPELDGYPAVKVDRLIADGERITLGPIALTTISTPGHTAGSTSWTTTTAGKRVLFASSITVAGEKLIGNRDYPNVVADFRGTFAKLRAIDADVFLNFHPEAFDIEAKRAAQRSGKADAFVDPSETRRQVDQAAAGFEEELARQSASAGKP